MKTRTVSFSNISFQLSDEEPSQNKGKKKRESADNMIELRKDERADGEERDLGPSQAPFYSDPSQEEKQRLFVDQLHLSLDTIENPKEVSSLQQNSDYENFSLTPRTIKDSSNTFPKHHLFSKKISPEKSFPFPLQTQAHRLVSFLSSTNPSINPRKNDDLYPKPSLSSPSISKESCSEGSFSSPSKAQVIPHRLTHFPFSFNSSVDQQITRLDQSPSPLSMPSSSVHRDPSPLWIKENGSFEADLRERCSLILKPKDQKVDVAKMATEVVKVLEEPESEEVLLSLLLEMGRNQLQAKRFEFLCAHLLILQSPPARKLVSKLFDRFEGSKLLLSRGIVSYCLKVKDDKARLLFTLSEMIEEEVANQPLELLFRDDTFTRFLCREYMLFYMQSDLKKLAKMVRRCIKRIKPLNLCLSKEILLSQKIEEKDLEQKIRDNIESCKLYFWETLQQIYAQNLPPVCQAFLQIQRNLIEEQFSLNIGDSCLEVRTGSLLFLRVINPFLVREGKDELETHCLKNLIKLLQSLSNQSAFEEEDAPFDSFNDLYEEFVCMHREFIRRNSSVSSSSMDKPRINSPQSSHYSIPSDERFSFEADRDIKSLLLFRDKDKKVDENQMAKEVVDFWKGSGNKERLVNHLFEMEGDPSQVKRLELLCAHLFIIEFDTANELTSILFNRFEGFNTLSRSIVCHCLKAEGGKLRFQSILLRLIKEEVSTQSLESLFRSSTVARSLCREYIFFYMKLDLKKLVDLVNNSIQEIGPLHLCLGKEILLEQGVKKENLEQTIRDNIESCRFYFKNALQLIYAQNLSPECQELLQMHRNLIAEQFSLDAESPFLDARVGSLFFIRVIYPLLIKKGKTKLENHCLRNLIKLSQSIFNQTPFQKENAPFDLFNDLYEEFVPIHRNFIRQNSSKSLNDQKTPNSG